MNAGCVYHEYLHSEFCTRTHQSEPFDEYAGTLWWQWCSWCPLEPWGADELRLVITWLRREVKAGHQRTGCLAFGHLIGRPEQFASYLSQARHWLRQRRARSSGRRVPSPLFCNH